ncbi:radical SAM/SPASM domain-containing protein [Streptomyces hesseae]|uniref:Radical SAM protein n=1 Tax=Streptomyces hesseae TaxID=3075519 RepID=A0ABU2SXN2_9ACTN|nr:radical SAM protein [Streptomyces sp. DSM 40473]MDT0453762.1 radical SAM protein [Streptomyces sp. DSM 40473]
MNVTLDPRHQVSDLYRALDDSPETDAVSVIVKVRGETCDIDCLHCYEKRKESPGGARISADQLRLLPGLFPGRPIAVGLHGGEPLTAGKDHMAGLLRELAGMPQVVRVTMQTNGVSLDGEWLDLFDALYPELRIGISLDGDAEGNRWRVGYDGKPTYPAVIAALGLLSDRGRQAGIITTVTPAVLGRPAEVLDHLAGFAAVRSVSFVPCFDTTITRPTASSTKRTPTSRIMQIQALNTENGPAWSITPDEYAEFVIGATAHWIRAGHFRKISLSPAVPTIRRLRGLDTSFCHFSATKCDHVFTLYPSGRMGSCDELPWPQAQLAVLDKDTTTARITAAQKGSNLLGQGKSLMNKCVTCDYRSTCGGGCIATRWRMNLGGDHDAYCAYRMRIIDATAALLADPAHPEGAWCQTLRWRPRSPNSMRDIPAFLATWDAPEAPRHRAELHTSAYGNINTKGLPGVHAADDLDPAHPQWADAIESGVKPLIDVITGHWGLATYDSCEGHQYDSPATRNTRRRLGILPRNPGEYAAAAGALCRTAEKVTPRLPEPVRLIIARSNLTCETTGLITPVLDTYLAPAPAASWPSYFAALGAATDLLRDALASEEPSPGASCRCPVPPGNGTPEPPETKNT